MKKKKKNTDSRTDPRAIKMALESARWTYEEDDKLSKDLKKTNIWFIFISAIICLVSFSLVLIDRSINITPCWLNIILIIVGVYSFLWFYSETHSSNKETETDSLTEMSPE
jgi:hypothetical protein